MIKILNLYAGIGGNRLHWGEIECNLDITAVEIDSYIAEIYQDFFPEDKVIIADAHEYLEKNYNKYDIIWSSPPCPTHSGIRKHMTVYTGQSDPKYPDMDLYAEILFLDGYFDGDWVVENVKSWYEPLIEPQVIDRHYFWSNKTIPKIKVDRKNEIRNLNVTETQKELGIDLSKYKNIDKRKALRSCVNPKVGKHILETLIDDKQMTLDQIRG